MKTLYCGRCKRHVMDLRPGSTILENSEALCSECAVVRRGAELMLKDMSDEIKSLKRNVAELNRVLVTGSYA